MSKSRTINRYSTAFKIKVVSEIESGKLSISQARQVYDIGGGSTIQTWLRRHGKNHLLHKVVRIEMADEVSKIKQLEQDKQALESALAQSQLKILALESLIEAAEIQYGVEIKKNSTTKGSNSCERK
jgi:transposase-like protein